MEEFNHFCNNWIQAKPDVCNPQNFQQQDCDYSNKDVYSNREDDKFQSPREPDKVEPPVKKPKKTGNKDPQAAKRTRTTPEERKLVMSVYKNLLAGRCVETFGSGSVKRTSELTGLPLRSVYRIRNEELIAHGSIELSTPPADEDELQEIVVQCCAILPADGTNKPTKGKVTRQKRLSLIKKKIIFHVFDTLRSEQPDSSDSAVINLTSEITGCPVRTIHRIRVEEKSEQGLQGPKIAKAKDTKKYKLSFKKYGDDIRLAIRSTIYDLQARTEFPIIKEIHDAVNERLNLALSRSTLMRLIKHLGFFFVRKEGKKHVLVEKSRDANKKHKKPKVKASKTKADVKKSPFTPPDNFGITMFTNIPSDYNYLDMNKPYELPTAQYHPPHQINTCAVQIPSASLHMDANCSSSSKPKRVLAKLNSEEVRAAIRAVIYDLKVNSVTPTISEIQQNVKSRFNMHLARTTLHRHIKRAGFVFKKREGNKHILVEKPVKKVKKPRKPRGPNDPNKPSITKKTKASKKKTEEVLQPFQPPEFNQVSSELDSLGQGYNISQYEHVPLENKQYNTLAPVAQAPHLLHQQQTNEMLRQMPPPLLPIGVLHRDVAISHPRKLMTLTAAKNCGLQWS